MSDKITIEIDGRTCEAAPGEMIITVADREGISIPRFCYHEKLSIAANCRMCLVEAEQGGRPFPKPVPACATPVGDGMKVQTRSRKALDAQRGTMEFLLINHPLDCPICDQGGECELQDVSMGYGEDVSRFTERKRVVKDEDLGPLIATEMTRCIHCTRCVRFGAEIAGVRELGATGRGEDMRIGTFVAHTVAHELSGNIIDLCPVGALTSKPYRFTARAWELTAEPSIAPHDAVGSNIQLHVRNGRVMRVHPRDNEAINETWISDRDRFSYEGLNAASRLTAPMIKGDSGWAETDWQSVLHWVADGLQRVVADSGADQLGWLMAPGSTLEELYLGQKLLRGLGGRNIDSRLRQQDFSGDAADPALPWLGLPIADLEQQRAVLLIGSDIRQEQPLLAHRLRKAALAGAMVGLVNPYRVELTHPSRQLPAAPGRLAAELAAIAKAAGAGGRSSLKGLIATADSGDVHAEIAAALKQAGADGNGLVLLGALAEASPDFGLLKALAYQIADATGCRIGFLPPAANSTGAAFAGALPHRLPGARAVDVPGLDALAQLTEPRKAYVLWGIDPAHDLIDPARAVAALAGADLVVACTAFRTPSLEAVADVLLPISAFAETSGTFVNAAGDWQRFQGAVAPPGDARPGWKLLRVLGNMLELTGFEYASARDIHDALAAQCADRAPDNTPRAEYPVGTTAEAADGTLMRVGNVPIYAVDALVRAAPALQRTPLSAPLHLQLHPADAEALGLQDGDQVEVAQGPARACMPVHVSDDLARGGGRIPAAVPGSGQLGAQIGPIRVAKVSGENDQ
ncbi:NADH-quinone oxidoreductase subunit G [Thiohalocapsa marina]|uniref:NADH-quinone oxidoreductase n=1 Tax=Thiohalocapsa marina TaxID=424902 RepID=A0A5M8FQ29_9GAMM|nr:NADH-quinone oxidoreductase subunit NuoG [Thiohalocapsa marina]KAA6185251.1 NADH-quinone oxidoreductase subunit G [Thiohalocapsa marina]